MHQFIPCCLKSKAMVEAVYHTPRELLLEDKASLIAQINNHQCVDSRGCACIQENCICKQMLLRSMTDSLSKNIPQSTKSCIAPIEYFTDIHPKPYTQSKFKQKKVMQK